MCVCSVGVGVGVAATPPAAAAVFSGAASTPALLGRSAGRAGLGLGLLGSLLGWGINILVVLVLRLPTSQHSTGLQII